MLTPVITVNRSELYIGHFWVCIERPADMARATSILLRPNRVSCARDGVDCIFFLVAEPEYTDFVKLSFKRI